jgi:NACalpha-BTF3-like transcription factor
MKDFKLDTNEKVTSGFKIPDNYFDDFSKKVMQRLPKEEPRVISFYAKNKRWIYSAAAVLVLALSVPIVYQMQNKEAEMTSSEVENYLVNNTTLSDDDIVNLLEQEDIDKLKEEAPIEKETLEEALSNNPEIEQYITN